jgi:hypothetical protein
VGSFSKAKEPWVLRVMMQQAASTVVVCNVSVLVFKLGFRTVSTRSRITGDKSKIKAMDVVPCRDHIWAMQIVDEQPDKRGPKPAEVGYDFRIRAPSSAYVGYQVRILKQASNPNL